MENKPDDSVNKNIKMLERLGFYSKTKAFSVVMLLMLIFCLYFVISFVLIKDNYEKAPKSIEDLQVIFLEEPCSESILLYLRENAIRNDSIKINENQDAMSYFLDFCMTIR